MKSLRTDEINVWLGPASRTQSFDISPDNVTLRVLLCTAAHGLISSGVDSPSPEFANQKRCHPRLADVGVCPGDKQSLHSIKCLRKQGNSKHKVKCDCS
jgi:hypothetical protein